MTLSDGNCFQIWRVDFSKLCTQNSFKVTSRRTKKSEAYTRRFLGSCMFSPFLFGWLLNCIWKQIVCTSSDFNQILNKNTSFAFSLYLLKLCFVKENQTCLTENHEFMLIECFWIDVGWFDLVLYYTRTKNISTFCMYIYFKIFPKGCAYVVIYFLS